MKRTAQMFMMIPAITLALLAGLVAAPSPAQAQTAQGANVHSVAMSNGAIVAVMVKADGRMYTREYDPLEGWSGFYRQGSGNWASADIAVSDAGNAMLVAVKNDGSLWTRESVTLGQWFDFERHGANTWSPGAAPSITMTSNGADADTSRVVISAIKADGRLYLREWNYQTARWGEFQRMGRAGWANAEVVMTEGGANREIWMIGTKDDGRLYTRKKDLGAAWEAWKLHGAATWSTTSPPSIDAKSPASILFGAVKADGRLYTREVQSETWSSFTKHGAAGWVGVEVALTESGGARLLATKGFGGVYGRNGSGNQWSDRFETFGSPNWSSERPSLGADDFGVVVLLVKDSGALYLRFATDRDGLGSWLAQGRPDWTS